MADETNITYSLSDDKTEVIFSAKTPKGEEEMEYRQAAQARGLLVVACP